MVPLFFVLDGKSGRAAFGWGYLCGLIFFGGTLWWFVHVTLPGAVLLIMYLAVYFGLFGWGYALFSRHKLLLKLFLLPCLWVVLEYTRANFLTGFGWVCLGHSQYKNLAMIQIADITGVYGVSFLIVLVNFFIKKAVEIFWLKREQISREFMFASLWVFKITALCFLYGLICLFFTKTEPGLTVAVIQANIAQSDKWEPSQWPAIMEKYMRLTREAARQKPDVIIWPETAFPGFEWQAPELFSNLKDMVRDIKIPLIFGLVTTGEGQYYNSALLMSKEGEKVQQYDKLHLVPFGEYVPLRKVFPFLSDIVPIGDFNEGKEHTIFNVTPANETQAYRLALLICFEDTLPYIARDFVRLGTNILVNITNDAWFLDTAAPFMHLQAAVFRTIENRRSLVRAANTGVSAFIDPLGKIRQTFHNTAGKMTFIEGSAIGRLQISQQNTVYTKLGDIFTYLCFGGILVALLFTANKKFFVGKRLH